MRGRPAAGASRLGLLVAALAFAAGPGVVWAAGIRVEVDKKTVTPTDQIALRVQVIGGSGRPSLPDLPDFQVFSAGESSQMQWVNGQMAERSVVFTYVLSPRRVGTFEIGPVTVELDGETYSSEPFSVEIVESTAEAGQEEFLFVTTDVSDPSPFVGEQVIYTWRLFRRVNIADARLDPFDGAGFLVEDLGKVREYEEVRDGQRWAVSELKKALFPQRSGHLEVPETLLRCEVVVQRRRRGSLLDDFFFGRGAATETRLVRGAALPLEVRPLPPAPADYSGLVGRFALSTSVSRQQLAVGESTTLEITVSGRGNARFITEPEMPELTRFKVYGDKPTGSVEARATGVEGTKIFRKALVPLEPGVLEVPTVRLVYFDPEAEKFRTAATPALPLEVASPTGEEELVDTGALSPSSGKVAVRVLADDILPIHKELGIVAPRAGDGLWWGGLLAPPLVYLGLLLIRMRSEREDLYAEELRRRRARRRAESSLGRMPRSSDGGPAYAESASRVLREYVGDWSGREGTALTPGEVREILEGLTVDADRAAEVETLLRRLEAVRFGGAGGADLPEVAELRDLVQGLDRVLRRGGRR